MVTISQTGMHELSAREMRETEGGLVMLLALGAVLLLSACATSQNPPPKTIPDGCC